MILVQAAMTIPLPRNDGRTSFRLSIILVVCWLGLSGCCGGFAGHRCSNHQSLTKILSNYANCICGKAKKHQSDWLIEGQIIGMVEQPQRETKPKYPRFHRVPVKLLGEPVPMLDAATAAPPTALDFSPEMPQLQPIPEGQQPDSPDAPEPSVIDLPSP